MNRKELEQYIQETYVAQIDYPWVKYPSHEVFRHENNKKWFALVMDIPKSKLGISGNDTMSVVNVKCDKILVPSLWERDGIFPAYHMSKEHWITIALDGSVPNDTIKMLLDMSFEATKNKRK